MLRAEPEDKSGNVNSISTSRKYLAIQRQKSDTESRIMEVEMRLKRQLSLSELGNLAKMAETELINSRLSSKIGELEYALRHATDAAGRAAARMVDSEKRMEQIKTQLAVTGGQLHEAGERLLAIPVEDHEQSMREKIRWLESVVSLQAKEKQSMEAKVSQRGIILTYNLI